MGTSTSSSGPGPGVTFDPPWLEQLGGTTDPETADQEDELQTPADEIAPARRFSSARRALKDFAHSGDTGALAKAAGHYSKTGMGGAKNVANRMRASTRSAAGLVGTLQAARDRVTPEISQWVTSLIAANSSAQDVINEIIEQVMTGGGSVDEDACKDSMAQSMAELLELNPDVDLLNMNNSDIWILVELFLGNEACSRMHIDIGQLFESATISPRDAVHRTNEMRDFLKAELAVQLQTIRSSHQDPNPTQLEKLMRNALRLTFSIYEDEL